MDWESFKNPPNKYRSASFWAWNDELIINELLAQIDQLEAGGFGGFFMHARGDMKTPYLSKMMMDCIKACVKYANSKGMDAWIYDEHGWPSGQADGKVQKIRNSNMNKHLSCKPAEDNNAVPGEICRDCVDDTEVIFSVEYGSGVEQLDPQAVKDFIELTHELYKENCGEYFANTIPGTFFDEPQYAAYYDENDYVPWANSLPGMFKDLWGYDIIKHLKSLFFDVDDYKKVRIHFWYTVSELYAHSFTKQIMDWCGQNKLISTGHFEWEETFYGQIRCCGNLMRQYEFMHYPGNDHLGRNLNSPWIYKQTASVAAQLAKPRYMVECFGVSGQNMSLHDKRWIYGKLLSLGVNFLVSHISLYSFRGDNKRDHPPFNLHQQPWWKYNHYLEDSVARAAYILSHAKVKADVLLINPIVTAWSNYKPGSFEQIDELQKHYEQINLNILNNGINYHIGDEMLFTKYAKIKGKLFCVGEMEYSAVILPYMENLLPGTIELLQEFSSNGGNIGVVGKIPSYCECIKADYLEDENLVLNWVKSKSKPDAIFGTGGKELWVQCFEVDGCNAWLISNNDREESITVKMIPVDCSLAIERLQTETGNTICIKSAHEKECTFSLTGGEFAILMQKEDTFAQYPLKEIMNKKIDCDGQWRITSKLHTSKYKNCSNLDFCRLKMDDGTWSIPLYTRDVFQILTKENKEEKQVLFGWTEEFKKVSGFQTKFEFINNVPGCPMALCVENPEDLGITVNSQPLRWLDTGYFIDNSFRTCDISEYVCAGQNNIVLSGKKQNNLTFEDIYILGDFAVALDESYTRVFSPLPETVMFTNHLDESGYKFFAGELSFSYNLNITESFAKANLIINHPDATAFEVIINEANVGALWCSPWKTDISKYLKQGTNLIEIKVVNSLRNLLGPLHNTLGEFNGIGPAQFNNKNAWSDKPISVPLGFDKIQIELLEFNM